MDLNRRELVKHAWAISRFSASDVSDAPTTVPACNAH